MKTRKARKPEQQVKVIGEVKLLPLNSVRPNTWNPNEMTPYMLRSLRKGIQSAGWLSSQALLVWGKDEKGNPRNVIIDGEHRWMVGRDLGMEMGPMQVIDGLTEEQAKALTLKFIYRHGQLDKRQLAMLVRGIEPQMEVEDLAFELGIEGEEYMRMMAEEESNTLEQGIDAQPPPPGSIDMPSGKAQHQRVVQLYYSEKQHTEFEKALGVISGETKPERVLEAMRRVSRAPAQ